MSLDPSLDLNLLRVLDAVLEEGSTSAAGQRLGLSQSAISHALRRLRETLGDPLVVRVGNGMVPTARGEALRQPVRQALADLERALTPDRFDPTRDRRSFRLSLADYVAMVLLPELTARICRDAPGLRLRVPPGADTPEALASGEADLSFGVWDLEDGGADIHQRRLWQDRLVCVLRRDHPALSGWDLPTWLALPHVQIAPRGLPGGPLDDVLAEMGLSRSVVLAAPHFLSAPFVVAASDAVAAMPERTARRVAASLDLEIVEPPLKLPAFTISMRWHARSRNDAAHRWLREQVLRCVG